MMLGVAVIFCYSSADGIPVKLIAEDMCGRWLAL